MSIHIGFADAVRRATARGDVNGWRHDGYMLNRDAWRAPLKSTERRRLEVFIYTSPETTTHSDREAWKAASVMRDAVQEAEQVIRANRMMLRAGRRL